MFNLLPGQGLGFTGPQLMAFGLAPVSSSTIELPEQPRQAQGGGGGGGVGFYRSIPYVESVAMRADVIDNLYSRCPDIDDDEIVEIVSILFGVIE